MKTITPLREFPELWGLALRTGNDETKNMKNFTTQKKIGSTTMSYKARKSY
jgi:hypothetical protein